MVGGHSMRAVKSSTASFSKSWEQGEGFGSTRAVGDQPGCLLGGKARAKVTACHQPEVKANSQFRWGKKVTLRSDCQAQSCRDRLCRLIRHGKLQGMSPHGRRRPHCWCAAEYSTCAQREAAGDRIR